MPKAIFPDARSEELVITELDGEILVYDKARDKAHCLNQTAALAWKFSNGERSVSDIAQAMQKELQVPVDEQIVWFALGQLEQDHLLRDEIALPRILASVTRREFVKQMGVAALVISVPRVISMTAPESSLTLSCLANGQPCTSGTQCCSGLCSGTCFVCFAAGTPVWLADGTTRRIENLCTGDFVLSRDETTGQMAVQRIAKTFVHLTPESLVLHFANGKNIHTTGEHPFFADGAWVEARHIEPKMQCVTPGDAVLTVAEIESVSRHIKPVYNLELSPFHTYYVGESAAWVHNYRTSSPDS